MRTLRYLIGAALFAMLASCSDQTGPPVEDTATFAKGGRWANDPAKTEGSATASSSGDVTVTNTCSSDGSASGLPACTLRHRADAPPLETYSTSFTAVQGEITYFVVHYLEQGDDGTITKTPFMTVTIPKAARFVAEDGTNLKHGDSVQVTVNLDRENFHVEFGPHGSSMRPAATLWYALKYADMSGFDSGEASVFYRPQEGDQWTSLDTEFHRIAGYLFTYIYHFSGYAVAW